MKERTMPSEPRKEEWYDLECNCVDAVGMIKETVGVVDRCGLLSH